MRLRFSLFALFLLTTLVAIVCYWFALPTINARKFVTAIEAKNFDSADRMFIQPQHQFIAKLMKDRPVQYMQASWRAQTLKELFLRTCEVTLTDYGFHGTDENGTEILAEGYMYDIGVTAWGLQKPERYKPISGSFGGG
jgi:hypothetical protein